MGSSGFHTWTHVILPAALPFLLSGMKQGWAFAWRSLMAAEIYVTVLGGLGLGGAGGEARQAGLGVVMVARQAGRPAQRDPCCLDRQRARAAQRIDERRVGLPAALQDQPGGQSFVERGLGLDRPVAALVQRLARAIEAEHRLVLMDVQVEADHRFVDVDAGPPAAPRHELVADGVLGLEGRILGVRDPRVADVAVHRQRVLGREVLGPVDGLHGFVQFFRRGDRDVKDGLQNADGGAQPEVGLVKDGPLPGKGNTAAARVDVDRPEPAQFVRQDCFQPAGTGREVTVHNTTAWRHDANAGIVLAAAAVALRLRLSRRCASGIG